jgi:hypothetical protein
MTIRREFVLIGLSLAAILACPFFGFVYNLPEERREGGWDLFIKPSPSFQFFFKNPAETKYDLVPFDQLDDARKEATRRYCKLRYGLDDIPQCYRRMFV